MPLRKISRNPEDFIKIIYQVANELKLENIEFNIEVGTEDIDSFVGGTYKVQINGHRDGHKIKHTVIVKWHPNEKQRSCYRKYYKREIIFYKKIVPLFLDIQNKFKVIEGLKMKFPNCIFMESEYNQETIVVHYMGLKMLDRFHNIDLQHATLVMKNLAKLHALSFVLEKSNPRGFEEIKVQCNKDVQYSDPQNISKSMDCYYNASVNVVSDKEAKEKLKDLGKQFLLVLSKCVEQDRYSVFCHADCWNNNILFKYKGSRPVEMIMVDYQLLRFASPVTDLSYYFYMTADRGVLTEHYDNLINIYYLTLSAVLKNCDLNVTQVYPEDEFKKHLKLYSVLGLIEGLVAMKIITAETEEACKMAESIFEFENKEIRCANVTPNKSLFVEKVNLIVSHFFERDYSLTGVLNKPND